MRLKGRKPIRARTVIVASGPLSNVSLPDIPGIDTFEGTKIHSARWNHEYDFSGKKVAVIGTGASAVQIIPNWSRPPDRSRCSSARRAGCFRG